MPSSPGFFPKVQRKVNIIVHHKQYNQCREWEQEVLETIKLEANGPERLKRKITLRLSNLWMQWEVDLKEKSCKFARNTFPYGKNYVTCPPLSFFYEEK